MSQMIERLEVTILDLQDSAATAGSTDLRWVTQRVTRSSEI